MFGDDSVLLEDFLLILEVLLLDSSAVLGRSEELILSTELLDPWGDLLLVFVVLLLQLEQLGFLLVLNLGGDGERSAHVDLYYVERVRELLISFCRIPHQLINLMLDLLFGDICRNILEYNWVIRRTLVQVLNLPDICHLDILHEDIGTHVKYNQHNPQPHLPNQQIRVIVYLIHGQIDLRIERYPQQIVERHAFELVIPQICAFDVSGKGKHPKNDQSQ